MGVRHLASNVIFSYLFKTTNHQGGYFNVNMRDEMKMRRSWDFKDRISHPLVHLTSKTRPILNCKHIFLFYIINVGVKEINNKLI